MRMGRLLFGSCLLLLGACGSSGRDASGAGGPDASGGAPPMDDGGAGGTKSQVPEPGTGQSEQTSLGEAAAGAAGDGALGPQNLCPSWTQLNALELDAVLGGANVTASATEAREALSASPAASPVPVHVRTQDFLNYYRPAFPEPEGAEPEVHLQLRPSTLPAQYDLLVAIRAPKAATRPKTSLTIVVDNTLSMDAGLAKAQEALLAISGDLQTGDTVQWITAAADATPKTFEIPAGSGDLANAINGLSLAPEQSVGTLLESAYLQARTSYVSGGCNRVLLVSDGAEDPAVLPAAITDAAAPGPTGGIRLVALGTGPARTNGHRLLRVAGRLGRGVYHYLDTASEATGLAGRFDELFGVALDDVKLKLMVPWYFSVLRPYLGDVAPSGDSLEPQYVAPGGAMVFLFRLEACAAGATDKYAGSLQASFSWISPLDGSPQQRSEGQNVIDLLASGSAEVGAAFAVAGYAEALRSLDKTRLEAALAQVQAAGLGEIQTLLEKHPALTAP